jgi:hypothetical protein
VAVGVDPNAAVAAEHVVVGATWAKTILAGTFLAGEQPESVWLDADGPAARLPAVRAIAFPGACREIEICFEAQLAAMTASLIRLLGHTEPMPRSRPFANGKLQWLEPTPSRRSMRTNALD